MRSIILAFVLFTQTSPLPPPFPRDGVTKLLENDRVVVWDISWLKQAYPVHHHIYDFTGVYYTNGDRFIVSPQGARSPARSVAWDTFFLRRGIIHSEEGASDEPLRAVFVEFKEPAATGAVDSRTSPAAFPGASGKQIRDSERVTIWDLMAAQGPALSSHLHVRDAVVVTFKDLKPQHVTFVARGTVHDEVHTAGADRAYLFEVK